MSIDSMQASSKKKMDEELLHMCEEIGVSRPSRNALVKEGIVTCATLLEAKEKLLFNEFCAVKLLHQPDLYIIVSFSSVHKNILFSNGLKKFLAYTTASSQCTPLGIF